MDTLEKQSRCVTKRKNLHLIGCHCIEWWTHIMFSNHFLCQNEIQYNDRLLRRDFYMVGLFTEYRYRYSFETLYIMKYSPCSCHSNFLPQCYHCYHQPTVNHTIIPYGSTINRLSCHYYYLISLWWIQQVSDSISWWINYPLFFIITKIIVPQVWYIIVSFGSNNIHMY